ncbi:hypothetical protein [Pectobacterium polaris]|uniref:hypothetical protein n=1 Tax=Pectobacterium polaris TaxID=2042057 RepID=UPI000FB88464|nr:hypothetical protein KHDHEBDM_01698 [Pectobacterium polaris]
MAKKNESSPPQSEIDHILYCRKIVSFTGAKWNGAYSLLGKLIDLRQANTAVNNCYVVVDSEAIGSQLQQLSLLFNETSHVLPFSARHKWLERLAA